MPTSCQNQKNLDKEIRNTGYDLMLNEYPQQSITSIVKKPPRCNNHSSETIYQGTVIIPYVKGISEKVKCITLETVSMSGLFSGLNKHCGTVITTGPFTEAHQRKQCVYNIPCKCGRCYTDKTSRPSEVCIKEHKYNFSQGLLEKSKLVQHTYKDHKICWKEREGPGN
jgi:hypothetical protein